MKTKKTKLNILIIVLFLLLMNSTNLFADEFWNNSFTNTPFTLSESSEFHTQSEVYYIQEMNFTDFFSGNLMSLNSGFLFSLGGSEGMESGTDTSESDHIHYANDVPISDGLLPLLMVVLVWLIIVSYRTIITNNNKNMNNMKRKMALVLLLLVTSVGMKMNAQVTIGNDTPPAATLDVVATKTDGTTAEGLILPRLTLAQLNAAQAQYGAAQIGTFVYVTDISGITISGYSDQITCVGYVYFNGSNWVSDCASSNTYATIISQPQAFTFYEEGTESEAALFFGAGGSSTMTYQWYIITGSNIHVRIARPCDPTDGIGATTNSFIPRVAGSHPTNTNNTKIASKNGFYRYYCVATNATGDSVTSDIAEVAVGCGAKDLNGEWLSFMCFNLGATWHAIAAQLNTSVPFSVPNASDASHVKAVNEEALYGDLFQWGRIADGHEKRSAVQIGSMGNSATDNIVSWITSTPPVYENGFILGTVNQVYPYQQVSRADLAYYGKFILAVASNSFNWYSVPNGLSTAVDQLWRQSVFAPNDPCQKIMANGLTYSNWYPPASSSTSGGTSGTGWRLPTQHEWGSIYRGGTISGSPAIALANTWDWYQLSASNLEGAKGMTVKPDGVTTTLFLPANGLRSASSGMLYDQGSGGYYWSSSVVGVNAYHIYVGGTNINPISNNYRANGHALRCIKN